MASIIVITLILMVIWPDTQAKSTSDLGLLLGHENGDGDGQPRGREANADRQHPLPLSKVSGRMSELLSRPQSETVPVPRLDRGRSQPLQPYFYRRPRETTNHWTSAGQHNNNDHHMTLNDYSEAAPLLLDTHTTRSKTKSWPKRIRYDGEPFESIESLHRDPGHHQTYYTQQPGQHNMKYDMLSGGIFFDFEDKDMQRGSRTSTMTMTAKVKSKQMEQQQPPSTTDKNRAQSERSNAYDVDDLHVSQLENKGSRGGSSNDKWSATNRSRRRPELRVRKVTKKKKMSTVVTPPGLRSVPMDDHYDGGYDQPTNTGILQNFYGKDFDYDGYELASRGPYGNRIINDMTSRSDKDDKLPKK